MNMKKLMTYLILYCLQNPAFILHFQLSQLELITIQILNGHMWLMASMLDSAGPLLESSKVSILRFLSPLHINAQHYLSPATGNIITLA